MENKIVRTRIAPSPTGYPHIGTIYQALFNYSFARKHKGTFVIRIEDTDRTRFVEGAEDVIFRAIDWFGLTEDESVRNDGGKGPYRQSERLEIYHKYAQELVDKELAYFAYYPKEGAGQKKDYSHSTKHETAQTTEQPPKTLQEMVERGDWILRMRTPKDKETVVHDEIRGDIVFAPDQVTEQVLIKSDGYPTYHLAAVVDDHEMGITHVVRGEEWISSAPKHVLLYQYFGWDVPLFYHTPLLRNPDKSKLSKRHGHTSVTWYQEEGFLPEAILNFLALMGWTHPEEKEIFSLEEFISVFDLKDIRQVGPIFDLQKLIWMNGEYIRQLSVEKLTETVLAYEKTFGGHTSELEKIDSAVLKQLVELAQSRISTLKEFFPLIAHFLPDAQFHVTSDQEKEIAKSLKTAFENINEWTKENIFASFKDILTSHAIRMPVLYTIFTGQGRGLPLPESLVILGKETAVKRLDQAIQS